ncbi:MAG: hypothetical protein BJBARM5_0322 [Candidatus Parvarchaeum acidophilus ARMAN-5]|jgi:hypothetical protein|uniref:Uncharacterized protein n=1 Tax=Candidatus Parvarchaeum acidophilus ARMAN-5 TaxID=662762 RepID=D6GV21_PARA5|nr:MAG: hypothetical protein BJBARM5_0322 [Candidatus Parvarchaeum acidophilus ARMAN-5]
MESNLAVLKILIVIVIFMAAFAAILYVYPFGQTNLLSNTNNTNAVKLSAFLSSNNINLNNLSDKDLYYFYGGLSNNTIIFGCNYELYPSFSLSNLLPNSEKSEYQNIITDMALDSMCSVENTTNCTAAYKGIISFINNSMNSTLINSIFNSTYKEITNYYSEVNASGFGNLSIVEPLRYDIALFKSSKNISSKINAIVKMKEFPVNILFYSTGKMFNYYNETGIYGPFQFPVYKLINATSCNTSKIFNIVTDPKYFSSSIYTGLYKSLGNYTNICIITKSNNCNTSEMKSLNMSFYAN